MKIDRAALRRRARITLEREEEDSSYIGVFDDDQETIAWIKSELRRGNDWAWCSARVTARLHGLEGEDCLGQCSYRSRQDFLDGDYYRQMETTAVEDLATSLEAIANDQDLWEHDRVACIPCASERGHDG